MSAPSPFPTARVLKLPARLSSPSPKTAHVARSNSASMLGAQIRALRAGTRTSGGELAARAGVSRSMLSRVERGLASPSIETLERIADGLGVSISQFFARQAHRVDFQHVPAGRGIPVNSLVGATGGCYELLGHLVSGDMTMTPSLVRMDGCATLPSALAQEGLKFIYVLAGQARYRYGQRQLALKEGDALLFDACAPHGVEAVVAAPLHYLCAVFSLRR